jgi:hypothetical protein
MKKFLFILIFFLFSADCQQAENSGENVSEKDVSSSEDKQQDPNLFFRVGEDKLKTFEDLPDAKFPAIHSTKVSSTNTCDDVAKQLAGCYIPDDALNETRVDYANFIEIKWEELEESSMSKISEWSAENIAPHLNDLTTLLYPFGGPDIAYALKFFPKMQTYILLGLEPIGSFEHIKRNIGDESTFSALKQAFSSYLQKGYFITSEMVTQLSNRSVRGVLPLLLIELVKSGFSIDSIEELSINSEGQEVARQSGMIDCVKIVFSSSKEEASKSLYYIRGSALNSNRKLPYLTNFIKRFQFATFVKSASYILHDKVASQLKNFILENTRAILQDDTGIPFRNFGSQWDKYVFGEYERPTLPIFRGYAQPDLAKYYASRGAVKIPFKLGYGFNQERPNLLLAIPTRRAVVIQAQETKADNSTEGCPCKNKQPLTQELVASATARSAKEISNGA